MRYLLLVGSTQRLRITVPFNTTPNEYNDCILSNHFSEPVLRPTEEYFEFGKLVKIW